MKYQLGWIAPQHFKLFLASQLAHISESTILVSLLQPAPETYELFDDIILMAEGKIVYHGPKSRIVSFFESCGFKCPDRKGSADFLQEVIHPNTKLVM